MTKLTDLEICKKIAEIEGAEKAHFLDIEIQDSYLYIDDDEDEWAYYRNPLADDALCHQLQIKHNISLIKDGDEWWALIINNVNLDFSLDIKLSTYDKNPNRAICLAIIEAHKC